MRCLFAVALLVLSSTVALKDGECEVCLKALADIEAKLGPKRSDLVKTEAVIGEYCAKPPSEKEVKLCYYIDPIKREISQPLKNGVPADKICERLKKKSSEICALRFSGSPGAPKTDAATDFSKLRVSQLKSIMAEKGITCAECIEKGDFVKALEAARARNEL